MTALNTIVKKCASLIDTCDVSKWESDFLRSINERTSNGDNTTSLGEKHIDVLTRIYDEHFAPVAWRWRWRDVPDVWNLSSKGPWYSTKGIEAQPLYTAPPFTAEDAALRDLLRQAADCIEAKVQLEQVYPDEPPMPATEWDYCADQLAYEIRATLQSEQAQAGKGE